MNAESSRAEYPYSECADFGADNRYQEKSETQISVALSQLRPFGRSFPHCYFPRRRKFEHSKLNPLQDIGENPKAGSHYEAAQNSDNNLYFPAAEICHAIRPNYQPINVESRLKPLILIMVNLLK